MEIKEIFNTTKREIESKKFNIFIAICLKNKFFLNGNSINEENLKFYLNLALKNTKEKVLFLIADKIQVTNYNARCHDNEQARRYNSRRVLRDGDQIKENLREFAKKLPKEIQDKIDILQWEEYENTDSFCKKTTNLVYKEFGGNLEFREHVFNVIKKTMTDRPFTDKQYWEMCNYLLDEFSLVYSGLTFKEKYYGLFFYPQMDSTSHFIEDLKSKKIFSELAAKLPKEKVALAIVS